MNSPNNSDWKKRLQELEAEINPTNPATGEKYTVPETLKLVTDPTQYQPLVQKTLNWFNGLATGSKVVVAMVVILAVFTVLRSVFQLVAAVASLAIFGIVLYLVYKFLITPQSTDN